MIVIVVCIVIVIGFFSVYNIIANPSDAALPTVSTNYAPYGKSVVVECKTDLSSPVEYSWAKFGPQMEPIYDRVSIKTVTAQYSNNLYRTRNFTRQYVYRRQPLRKRFSEIPTPFDSRQEAMAYLLTFFKGMRVS